MISAVFIFLVNAPQGERKERDNIECGMAYTKRGCINLFTFINLILHVKKILLM